ncbi:hypothetical protein HELRODRAFT_163513 [Helobdella robusta]|uniref:Uncharacterized protein n=1 Tax=Helobdella robusta TaxID=6412 RepID=T1EU59_HELRO|nr:hypothetical protein HELRODRAFT_163513 [Helobdella robusta]ESN96452.1 hypothetical protein HELRODRAFT_163513 [Helobdella robusta]
MSDSKHSSDDVESSKRPTIFIRVTGQPPLLLFKCSSPLLSSYSGSSYVSSGLPPSSSSSSASTYTPRSRYDARSYDLPKSSSASRARSSSIDAPSHPRANYRDVKAPMSDTRRKVRDLICKTRKDPGYYE